MKYIFVLIAWIGVSGFSQASEGATDSCNEFYYVDAIGLSLPVPLRYSLLHSGSGAETGIDLSFSSPSEALKKDCLHVGLIWIGDFNLFEQTPFYQEAWRLQENIAVSNGLIFKYEIEDMPIGPLKKWGVLFVKNKKFILITDTEKEYFCKAASIFSELSKVSGVIDQCD